MSTCVGVKVCNKQGEIQFSDAQTDRQIGHK